jgi:hypothetical protein
MMEANVLQLITNASQILNSIHQLLRDASSSSTKSVRDLANNVWTKSTELNETISQVGVLAGRMEGEIEAHRRISKQPVMTPEVGGESALDAFVEMEERRERSRNVILMNVPECNLPDRAQRLGADHDSVINVLKKFEAINTNNIKNIQAWKGRSKQDSCNQTSTGELCGRESCTAKQPNTGWWHQG